LVFLDEPTSGLDPLGRLLVRDLIDELRRQGTAVFLNSHLLSEVEITCDRVAFVKKGEVVRELNLKEEAPALGVELKLGITPKETLEGLTRFGTNLALQNGCVKLQVSGEEMLPEITRWLVGEGVKVYQIAVVRKSLESVFLEVMGGEERPG
jgi:ABC-2 type transport system ATP-binding protein